MQRQPWTMLAIFQRHLFVSFQNSITWSSRQTITCKFITEKKWEKTPNKTVENNNYLLKKQKKTVKSFNFQPIQTKKKCRNLCSSYWEHYDCCEHGPKKPHYETWKRQCVLQILCPILKRRVLTKDYTYDKVFHPPSSQNIPFHFNSTFVNISGHWNFN